MDIERLRGFAILMVFLLHWDAVRFALPKFLQNSWTGVDLFFVISGFVVSKSFFRLFPKEFDSMTLKARLLKCRTPLKIFFIRRFLRILPLALFWLFFCYIGAVHFNQNNSFGYSKNPFSDLLAALFYYYNYFYAYGHGNTFGWYWSLSLEEQFYVLFPLYYLVIGSQRKLFWASIILSALAIFLIRPFAPYDGPINFTWANQRFASHMRFDTILAGVILFLVHKNPTLQKLGNCFNKKSVVTLISSLCLIAIAGMPNLLPHHQMVSFGFVLVYILSAFILFLAAQDRETLFSWPVIAPLLNYLGSRSYGIYLTHYPALALNKELQIALQFNSYWQIALYPLTTLLMTELGYHLIEQPIIRWSKKITPTTAASP